MVLRIVAVVCIALCAGSLRAQESQKAPTPDVIDSLRAEIAALRHIVTHPAAPEIPPALKQENQKRDSLAQQVRKDLDAVLKSNNSAVKFSGTVFAYYGYTTYGVDGKDANKIDVDRFYLTAKGNVTDNTRFQFTSDVYRNSATGTYYAGLSMRLKFAYVEYAPASDLTFRIGMIPTHWQGYVDALWKYRVLVANITDNTRAGYGASADIGFSATYALPSKLGEVNASIFNGNGYTAAEANRFKDVALRASVNPIADQPLSIGAYYYKGANQGPLTQALAKDRWGALAGYIYKGVSAYIEYNEKHEQPTSPDTNASGKALSFFGEIKSPLEGFAGNFAFLWRFDYIDPSTVKGRDLNRFWIVGLAYKFNEKLTLIADRQMLSSEPQLKRVDNALINYDAKWYLHVLLNF